MSSSSDKAEKLKVRRFVLLQNRLQKLGNTTLFDINDEFEMEYGWHSKTIRHYLSVLVRRKRIVMSESDSEGNRDISWVWEIVFEEEDEKT